MSNTADDELVTLDELALALCSGAQAMRAAGLASAEAKMLGPGLPNVGSPRVAAPGGPKLGPPSPGEVSRWLRAAPTGADAAGKGFVSNGHALSIHCTASITQGALGLLNRMAGH